MHCDHLFYLLITSVDDGDKGDAAELHDDHGDKRDNRNVDPRDRGYNTARVLADNSPPKLRTSPPKLSKKSSFSSYCPPFKGLKSNYFLLLIILLSIDKVNIYPLAKVLSVKKSN